MLRKGLAVVVILLFISVSVIPSTGNIVSFDDNIPLVTTHFLDSPEPEIDLEVKYGIGLKIIIENIGEVPANNMTWGFRVRGGHFNRINKSFSGDTASFEPGEKIVERIFIFGFGFIYTHGTIKWQISPQLFSMIIYMPEPTFLFGLYLYSHPA